MSMFKPELREVLTPERRAEESDRQSREALGKAMEILRALLGEQSIQLDAVGVSLTAESMDGMRTLLDSGQHEVTIHIRYQQRD